MLKKINKILIILLVMILGTVIVGCDPNKAGEQTSGEKVALLLTGTINDAGWSESAYKGFERAKKEFKFEGAYSENLQLPDFESAIRDYATKGFNTIVLSSADFSEIAKTVSPDYPEVKFVLINGQQAMEPNLANYRPNTPEAGFIAGAFAGLISKTNTVGMIGGKKLPPVQDATAGFIAGAKYTNPSANVLTAYIDSFTDIAKGTEATLAMIESGADVVCSNTGQAALGTIDVAKAKGIYAVGYIEDQNKVAPGTVPFSAIQDVGDICYRGISDAVGGDFKAELVLVGAKDNVIRLSDFYKMGNNDVSKAVQDKMEEIYKGIVDGSLKSQGILPKSGFEK
jgi:basic membrane protein A